MKHTISVLLRNQPGVLSRVTGLFSGRGFNIESLCVAETHNPKESCLTIVTKVSPEKEDLIEQITKQLHKLIDVIKVIEHSDHQSFVEREMMFVRVNTDQESHRAEILRIIDIFKGKIVDVAPKSYSIEITGTSSKIATVIELLQPFGIKEIVRTGTIAMARVSKTK